MDKEYTPRKDRKFTAFQWVAPYHHPDVCKIYCDAIQICDVCGYHMDIHGLILDIDGMTKHAICPNHWVVRNYHGAVFIMTDEHFWNTFEEKKTHE